MPKRIAVVGAGAVGGYLGGHLARTGNDVTLIDPWPEHVEAIRARGLQLSGMTDEETEKTGRLLQGVAEERAVLVIEHDMEFVRSIARTVTVLHEGGVLCEGPVDRIQKDERVMEVYLGRSRDADE